MGISIAPPWVCPDHRTLLSEEAEVLRCANGHEYSRQDDIPRFVPRSNYADAFGLQWKRYRQTQLDSYTKTTITRDRLRRCMGPDLWDSLPGMQVLEAGCGAGRFTEWLLAQGAIVTSIDLSDACEANAVNFPPNDRHRIAQADIMRLPFSERQYDVVLCLGVLQHTPDTEKAISRLWEQVKPGGFLVIDHYTFSLSWCTKSAILLRPILKRLPPARGLLWTEWMVRKLFPLHRALSKASAPICWLRPVLSRISPVQTYFHHYPQLSEEDQYGWSLLDTHDSLTDWYHRWRYVPGMKRYLRMLGAMWVDAWYGGNGIEARAQRACLQGPNASCAE
jgi:SAM-dependent methyltransferase